MRISMIAAVAANDAIGINGKMPWHIPTDLKFFSRITRRSGVVVMGRKTHESMGRELPGRVNIVISRDKNYQSPYNCLVMNSIEACLSMLRYFYGNDDREIMIIGGGDLYREFMPHAGKLYLTRIDSPIHGDTFFPEVDTSEWKLTQERPAKCNHNHNLSFSFNIYERING